MHGTHQDESAPERTIETPNVELSRLFAELDEGSEGDPVDLDQQTTPDTETVEQPAREVLNTIRSTLFSDSSFRFDEELVKQSLDEILVLLIAMRTEDTNGKSLMTDLTLLFDSQLSPGTVYPALHGMESDEVLEMFELVRSKEYRIDDREAANAMVTEAARQYLALGSFFYLASAEL